MSEVIAFVGGGNMAASLIGGLLAAGRPAASLRVAEISDVRRDWLAREFGVAVHADAMQAAADADAVVLAVKPQHMRAVCAGLSLKPGAVVVSIAAGIRLDSLRRWLGDSVHYVRCMPNTPALLRAGITGLYAPPQTPVGARQLAGDILAAAGECVWLDSEAQMDAVTALSGSGPAYYFLLTEVLRDAGVKLGLSEDTAARLARQTFIGAARMAEGDTDVAELRARVTSKGGTTEAAVSHLEAAGLRGIFTGALTAAARRGAELGDQLDAET
ncbi:pyrroline-5-carboxylate reductase [Fontimonas sp. SYSU GA230001]|uniref:pyrroline-5-carboxylate reductase n=1 Tax=Fontimonas sp. SYSU GA230001 TaxID=3142450 RepID=UPI0032B57141